MPEVRDIYRETESLELPDLHRRREEITSSAPDGDYSRLPNEALTELLAVNRALRKKVAANAGTAKRASAKAAKTAVPIEDLL